MYNIILITIDSLRPDFIGCYNENAKKEELTPNIDNWAKDAVIFKTTISQGPRTPESFPALLSGQYSCRYLDIYKGLSPQRVLISEILKKYNYYTAAFNTNPYISRHSGYNRGFDYYKDNLLTFGKHGLKKKFLMGYVRLRNLLKEPYIRANKLNKQVLSWLERANKPFFLWIHYMDVHGPYISKKGLILLNRIRAASLWHKAAGVYDHGLNDKEKHFLVETYKEEVRHLDFYINDIFKNIDDTNTLTILTADHGEMLGEHNLFGHGFELYEELLHIPLIIKPPQEIPVKNKYIDTPVKSLDIVPTILDVLNVKANILFDGKSLLPLIQGNEDEYSSNEPIFSEIWTKYLAVRKGEWKLIANYAGRKLKLFNLKEDPKEQNNLADKKPEVVSELKLLIKQHLLDINAPSEDVEKWGFKIDEEIKAQLKALGYF